MLGNFFIFYFLGVSIKAVPLWFCFYHHSCSKRVSFAVLYNIYFSRSRVSLVYLNHIEVVFISFHSDVLLSFFF